MRGGGLFGGTDDVLHRNVNSQWPLIQRLLADPVYAARYRTYLEQTVADPALEAAERRMLELHTLISPWVVGERRERASHTTISSAEAFERAIDGPAGMRDFARRRRDTVRAALDETAPR
jgi:hypothetical protein